MSSIFATAPPLRTKTNKIHSFCDDQIISFANTPQSTSKTPTFRIKRLSQSKSQTMSHMQFSRNNRESMDKEEDIIELRGLLDQSREENLTDKEMKGLVGVESVRKYYKHLKIQDRVLEENSYRNISESVFTTMHRSSNEQLILPCKVGLLKYEGLSDTIKLKQKNNIINDQEGIKKTQNVDCFELADNRITNQTSGQLIQSLTRSAKEVILTRNRIGAIGVQHISQCLSSKESRIEFLDLEDNQLGNKLVILLFQSLLQNKSIIRLNLSKNYICNEACASLSKYLDDNSILKEIYLYWNQIKGEGGALIFQALQSNQSLKVLDLGQNSLGSGNSKLCSEAFADLVQKESSELIHVDLSFNNFGLKETYIIADAMSKNNHIYGFHYTGNRGYVDSKGFIVPVESPDEDQGQSHVALRIKGTSYVNHQRLRQSRDRVLKDCCWICEGWEQRELKWVVDDDDDQDPVFVHLSYQDYAGVYLGGPNEEKTCSMMKMLPAGSTKYFFSVGNNQSVNFNSVVVKQTDSIGIVSLAGQDISIQIDEINEFLIVPNTHIIDQYYEPVIQCKPRSKDNIYIPPKERKQKQLWSFATSIFKDWRRDTEELLNQCFELDWSMNRAAKKCKSLEDLEQTKRFCRSIYSYIRETYKYYSCSNPIVEVWAISQGLFGQIVSTCKICETITQDLDSSQNSRERTDSTHSIKPSNCDIKFLETLAGLERNPRKPDRGMIRYQFMEVWLRLTEEKYFKGEQTLTMCEAIQQLWEQHLKTEFTCHGQKEWRENRYWSEPNDQCLKNYRVILEHIYSKHSKKNVKPGQKPFMCLQEFIDIFNKILSEIENLGASIPLTSFNLSMMTQVDELKSDRIFQMNFVEFLEAFSRTAEEVSLTPYTGAFSEGTQFSQQQLIELPLHFKIESLILLALDTACDENFKLDYKKPEKSFFVPLQDK